MLHEGSGRESCLRARHRTHTTHLPEPPLLGFTIATVSLDFSLNVVSTRVVAILELKQTAAGAAGQVPRTVQLHRAIGVAQEIVSLEVDGKALRAAADYAMDEKMITLEPPAGASASSWGLTVGGGEPCQEG